MNGIMRRAFAAAVKRIAWSAALSIALPGIGTSGCGGATAAVGTLRGSDAGSTPDGAAGAGTDDSGETGPTPADASDAADGGSAETADAGAPGDLDGGGAQDAGDASAAPACTPTMADAGLVDGMILGLPSADVPMEDAVVTAQVAATPSSDHFPKQIGVLNLSPTITDAQSVVHLLAPMGLPYAITTSAVLAVQHDMAIFFPEASAANPDSVALQLLGDYLQGGGVVVMKYSEVDALKRLGGVSSSVFRVEHHWVNLTGAGKARFPSLDQPFEQSIPLGGDTTEFINTWAITLDPTAGTARALANFDDGTAAIVENDVGAGHVITFGVDWRDVVLRNQLGHAIEAARGYIDEFEPATDSWMLMLRDVYDRTVRFGVRLSSAPAGARAALLVSHDLDWGDSYTNALVYAADEQARGASATYFVHTKYVTDWQDVAFFGPEREPQLASLLASGGRIGSHTVAHSPVLSSFPIGDGTEAYPTYAPVNVSASETTGGTLAGELRVSKALIDAALATQCVAHETVTFRAGNLSYHAASPQTMERLGYRFDSTRAVGDVLANFPFRAMTDWPDALDTSVFEFPVTLEDQQPPRIDQRVSDALSIISANADNGAPSTLLIHPNVLDYKENAEREILDGLPSGVTATSVDAFASFWRARDAARIRSIDYDDQTKVLTIEILAPEAVDGLTVRVDASVVSVVTPPDARLVPSSGENLVVLPPLAAGATLTLTLGYM